jgi:hypothetical protein
VDERRILINDQRRLPSDWNTIRKITRLDAETFNRLVAEGVICPTVERSEISRILRLELVRKDEQRVLDLVPLAASFARSSSIRLGNTIGYRWLVAPSPDMRCKASSSCATLMSGAGPSRNVPISMSGRPTISCMKLASWSCDCAAGKE